MIAIIDYGMGNLGSILNMLKRIGTQAVISSDAHVIDAADKIILPGVGAFDNGMQKLESSGLRVLLEESVLQNKKPILGICLGMQLMTHSSEEGTRPGLGWVEAITKRFNFTGDKINLKVPHMGWNHIRCLRPHKITTGLDLESRFYFVHSYYVDSSDESIVLAKSNHGFEFDSIIQKDNIIGVQFHPEKSHKFGMTLLKNFSEM
jgi:glutamine amidotransferase